jgi:BirA family biotin operon repressor/biotin-[acetyl-CoA-carboxylase] ligase
MSIRDSLLQALDTKPGQAVSGAELSQALGVSRTAIWKQIKVLKNLGLPIRSADRQGYSLKMPFDSSLLSYKGPSWVRTHYQISTTSTQTLAKAGAAAGLPEGHLWISEIQTKGRGRLDRIWDSGYAGLWFSLLLRPAMSALRVAPITLYAGLCLRDAVHKVLRVDAKLKWPNDLMIGSVDRGFVKVAGILTEMSGQMDRTEWLVIGVGVNVNNNLPDSLERQAVSLSSLTGMRIKRSLILDAFLDAFHAGYTRFSAQGFAPFRDQYWKHYFAPKCAIRLNTADGPVTGKAVGVDDFGAIMIESRRKIRTFNEGEIVL